MSEIITARPRGRGLQIAKRFFRSPLVVIGTIIILTLVVTAIFADVLAPYDYAQQDLMLSLEYPSREHWLGTDEFGRDVLSRIIHGARISLLVGFVAVSFAVVIGSALGAIAGFYGGKLDQWIMRIMDVVLSIPSILLAICIATSLGTGIINLMIAVGIASIPRYARIVRSSVISIRNMEYVEAAKAVGSSDFRIIFRHIIPNSLAPIIVEATLGVAMAIISAAGLSFIGLGVQPPTPEWGSMLSEGRQYIRGYPHLTLFPGLAIMLTIMALNFLGDGLRDLLDPKLKR